MKTGCCSCLRPGAADNERYRPLSALSENNFVNIEMTLDPSGKSAYNAIIARTVEPAREPSAAGFLFAFPPSDGGRTSRRLISPHPASASGASRRPSPDQHVTGRRARTRRPCGEPLRRMRPLRLRDIGFIDRRIRGRGHKRCIGTNRCNDRNSHLRARSLVAKKSRERVRFFKARWPVGHRAFSFWDVPQRGGDFLPCSRTQRSHHAAQQYAVAKPSHAAYT